MNLLKASAAQKMHREGLPRQSSQRHKPFEKISIARPAVQPGYDARVNGQACSSLLEPVIFTLKVQHRAPVLQPV